MADNYTLGRGELWFDRFDDLAIRGERYLGNTPEFNVSVEIETLEHFNSDRGFKDKDESVTIKNNYNGSFTTDNVNSENIALFFFGKSANLSIAAVTAGSDTLTRVARGLTYQIGVSLANPSGIRTLTSVTVKKGVTALVLDTDYTVDLELGRLYLMPNSVTVLSGDSLTVEYTAPLQTRRRIISGKEPISGALRYISYNPQGTKFDWYMPYVKLSPNGDYALKSDDWQKIQFNVEVLRKEGLEAIYVDGRPA